MDKSNGSFQLVGGALPDERRIAELAQEILVRSRSALSRLRCECRQGVLTIYGHLPSYYLKQVAQASVAQIEGVQRVENRVEVAEPVEYG